MPKRTSGVLPTEYQCSAHWIADIILTSQGELRLYLTPNMGRLLRKPYRNYFYVLVMVISVTDASNGM